MADNKEKLNFRDKIKKFFKDSFFWLTGYTPITELLKYNSRLKRCSLITTGDAKKKDNFILQIRKNQRAVILTVLPFLCSLIYHLNSLAHPQNEFSYKLFIKTIANGRWSDLIVVTNHNPAIVISFFTVFLTFMVMHIYFGLFVSNYEIGKKTKQLALLSKRLNLIDDDGESQILWTKIGILMQLKSSTANELIKNTTFWNQLDMEPGEIMYSKEEKKTFFVMSGFELADSYDFTIKD